MINRNNYELHIIDYLDGNLNHQQVEDLLLFLDQNHDIKEEFELLDNEPIIAENKISFKGKESLKKNVGSDSSITKNEELIIAVHEGDICSEESGKFKEFIKSNEELKKEYDLFGNTYLEAPQNIHFDNKSGLKKNLKDKLPVSKANYTEFLIADINNELSKEESQLLLAFININPDLKDEHNLYKKTVISADMSIVYEDKHLLKKTITRRLTPIYYTLAIAASILLLGGIFILNPSNNNENASIAFEKSFYNVSFINKTYFPDIEIADNEKITNNQLDTEIYLRKDNLSNPKAIQPIEVGSDYLAITNPEKEFISDMNTTFIDIQIEIDKKEAMRYASSELPSETVADDQKNHDDYYISAKDYAFSAIKNTYNKGVRKINEKANFRNIAEYAVIGVNALTKSDINISRSKNQDEKPQTNQKQKE